MESLTSFLLNNAISLSILGFLASNPLFQLLLAWLGGFLVVFRPILTGFKLIAKQTKTQRDDALIERVETSKFTKTALWFAEWIVSFFKQLKS